ncbi:MAG TPA: glycoside hydrolase family 15 protein [Candidatus Paceibacterota bacterium]|jgi:phosphorylase kinase alpha/beta subunit|nr:glycoside hydrolase family 15 protein [Candidatus Paceibacterota bacterium]
MDQANPEISVHLQTIRGLLAPTGLFLASAHDVSTGYNKAWLRDNFYTSLALEAAGDTETLLKVWRSILEIFRTHEAKINWAIQNKPHASWQYIHARYNPETFEEFWDEWGNKQNDAIGAILWKLGDLHMKNISVIQNDEDRGIVQRLVDYLASIEYWHDPDNGMWEEWEEVHASSVGACVAGLKAVRNAELAAVPDGLIEHGEESLRGLLPRESSQKFCDLALLSLIYPYKVTERGMEDEILKNLEYHLEKEMGIIRYKNDRYYNKNKDGWSEEAEWTFGFPWLSIIYTEREEKEKAKEYLNKARKTVLSDGRIPELFYSNTSTPNENVPLGWSESLYVVAVAEYAKKFGF